MSTPKIIKGNLLIAEPFLGDANFERSVVLVCEHDRQGSFGFILNQPSKLTLKDVLEGEETYTDQPLYIGGPVEQNTLHFIHRRADLIEGASPIVNGLYWGGDYEQMTTMLNLGKIDEHDIRFFLGYAGWISGQLVQELRENAWIVGQVDSSFIFDTAPDQFWRRVLLSMGGKYKMLANYPIDPSLN